MLPTRQVHLDFHTSPLIHDLLSEWDVGTFADTMKHAHVNSVTVFAKCHHGMSYYPTEIGTPHPQLAGRDLLGEMIEALQARDIHTPIYYTVGWEETLAYARPEWRQVLKNGEYARKTASRGAVDPDKWWFMSFLHPDYLAYMQREVQEICERYPIEGFFFDICMYHPEAGFSDTVRAFREEHCLLAEGSDADVQQARFIGLAKRWFASQMTPYVQQYHPEARCFYNSAHQFSVDHCDSLRNVNPFQPHWEIESIPSGFWGYYHFPRFARYVASFERPWLGMTGRFQRMWGDFGGIKPQAALEFECFRNQAHGGASSVGDQLPPRGKLEPAAYDLIGNVYAQVADAEPFYENTHAVFDSAILLASHASVPATDASLSEEGAVLMLEEAHYNPVVVDDAADISAYPVVVLPDSTVITDALYERLKHYYAQGGTLLLSYRAGCDVHGQWKLDFLPLALAGEANISPTYWRTKADFWPEMQASDRVFYQAGMNAYPTDDTVSVLIDRVLPYFQRTDEHFMSHFQAPPVKDAQQYPAVLAGERFVYFADPVFRSYRHYGVTTYRDVVERAIVHLVGTAAIGSGLSRTVLSLPRRHGDDLRLTLLHYVPLRKAIEGDVLEHASSFASERLQLATQQPVSVREYGGELLAGSVAEGFALPVSARGRLLLEVKNYFATS